MLCITKVIDKLRYDRGKIFKDMFKKLFLISSMLIVALILCLCENVIFAEMECNSAIVCNAECTNESESEITYCYTDKNSFSIKSSKGMLPQLCVEGEYVYNGLDQTNDIKIYFEDNGKVYLSCDDFIVTKNGKASKFINAGTYEIIVNYTNDNALFNDTVISLVMQKREIDVSKMKFENKTIIYDGSYHSIYVSGVDRNLVNVIYSQNYFKHASQIPYEVNVKLELVDPFNYSLSEDTFVAYLTILKRDVDMSNVYVYDISCDYSGYPVEVKIVGDIPSNVAYSCEYYSNGYKLSNPPVNVGVYDVIVKFYVFSDNSNYNLIPDKHATITIDKKIVLDNEIKFNDKTEAYNGENLYIKASGLPAYIDANYVYADTGEEFRGEKDIGEYNIKLILSSENNNYSLENYTPLVATLKIVAGEVSLRDVEFNDIEYVYDGKNHSPELIGDIPEYIVPKITLPTNCNVGEYIASVSFESKDSNYLPPANMYAKVKILPKKLTVKLEERNIDNDKYIQLIFNGVIDEANVYIQYDTKKSLMVSSASENYCIDDNSFSNLNNLSSNGICDVSTLSKVSISKDQNLVKIYNDFNVTLERYSVIESISNVKDYMVVNKIRDDRVIENKVSFDVSNMKDKNHIKVIAISGEDFYECSYKVIGGEVIVDSGDADAIILIVQKDYYFVTAIVLTLNIVFAITVISCVVMFEINRRKKTTPIMGQEDYSPSL